MTKLYSLGVRFVVKSLFDMRIMGYAATILFFLSFLATTFTRKVDCGIFSVVKARDNEAIHV